MGTLKIVTLYMLTIPMSSMHTNDLTNTLTIIFLQDVITGNAELRILP